MSNDRKYRVVPSERAHYAPGRWVVQYYDPGARVWFDHGDPVETESSARERIAQLQISCRSRDE